MADRPNVNPTPKQEFQSDKKWVEMHRQMMQQPMLSVSIQFALAHLQRLIADARITDGNLAAQAHFKMQGAYDFVSVLRNLGEMPELPPTKPDSKKLNPTI